MLSSNGLQHIMERSCTGEDYTSVNNVTTRLSNICGKIKPETYLELRFTLGSLNEFDVEQSYSIADR